MILQIQLPPVSNRTDLEPTWNRLRTGSKPVGDNSHRFFISGGNNPPWYYCSTIIKYRSKDFVALWDCPKSKSSPKLDFLRLTETTNAFNLDSPLESPPIPFVYHKTEPPKIDILRDFSLHPLHPLQLSLNLKQPPFSSHRSEAKIRIDL